MKTYHVIIPANIDPAAVELLESQEDFTVDMLGKVSREQMLTRVSDAHAMIVRSSITVDVEVFQAAPNLKTIARAGVGVDNIDLEEATRRGVVVTNTPSGNTTATAEHTLALMLALARHIPKAHASLAAGRWDRKVFIGSELSGKVLGIIGGGRVGQAVMQRAEVFGMQVIIHDPYVELDNTVSMVRLDELYARADYITLHTPVTDETRHMIDADSIRKMKDGVRIINAARGALIAVGDLADALRQGKVSGAAVDVYESEPPAADHPLIGLDNVVHTPHLGGSTYEAQVAVALDAARQIVDGLTGGLWRHVVNPDVFDA